MKPYCVKITSNKTLFGAELTFHFTLQVNHPFERGKKLKMQGEYSNNYDSKDTVLRFVMDNFSNGHDMIVDVEGGWERWVR